MAMAESRRYEITRNFLTERTRYQLSSPLFAALAQAASADDDIIELVSETRPGQSYSVLLLCVVHYLLLKSPDSILAQYFASIADEPRPPAEAFPEFRGYCLEHRDEIRELLSWRTVNTNLAEKACSLLPALRYIELSGTEPLTLLELCCSTGLNMLFDEYHYDYGPDGCLGPAESPVQLKCRSIGSYRPPLGTMPTVAHRVGVDLVKVKLSDPLQRLWMEAVLLPEWKEERARLKAALSIRVQRELTIIEGNALEVVQPLLEELPGRLCILMSYCRGHWSAETLRELDGVIRDASRHRDIHRLDVDTPDSESPQDARARLIRLAEARVPILRKRSPFRMDHTRYSRKQVETRLLGEGDIFGEWVDWHVTDTP